MKSLFDAKKFQSVLDPLIDYNDTKLEPNLEIVAAYVATTRATAKI